jgi:hypothetical protein
MPRASHPKPPPPRKSERNKVLVRTENVIPTMDRQAAVNDQVQSPKSMICTGHCGRCDVNPCQLHAKLAFRI